MDASERWPTKPGRRPAAEYAARFGWKPGDVVVTPPADAPAKDDAALEVEGAAPKASNPHPGEHD